MMTSRQTACTVKEVACHDADRMGVAISVRNRYLQEKNRLPSVRVRILSWLVFSMRY